MKKTIIGYLLFFTAALLAGVYFTTTYLSTQVENEPPYETPYDYKFESGDYTIYGVLVTPHEEPFLNSYHFSMFNKNRMIGNVLKFEINSDSLYNYNLWWKKGIVNCDINGSTALIRVGIFILELNFKDDTIAYTREYPEEQLGDLLTSSRDANKQIFEIDFDDLLDDLHDSDIVLFDKEASQIHYLTAGNFRGRILFDNQENILAYGVSGVICFDGNTGQSKNLPFNFAYQHNEYKFVDFLYDSVNEAYILAWTEPYEVQGMIPEEITHQEGIPNIHVSIFSADGLLLYDYDTMLMLPQYKIFDEHWPVLSLDDANGLQLTGYYLDGCKRVWMSMPKPDYLKILQMQNH